jgi:hypothetical protein
MAVVSVRVAGASEPGEAAAAAAVSASALASDSEGASDHAGEKAGAPSQGQTQPASRPASAARAAVGAAATSERGGRDREKVDFNFQIRPILSDRCFSCHGPDAGNRKAGLRLDTREGATGETKSGGRAVVPGNLDASELYWRITAEDDQDRMPPKSLNRPLSSAEIDLLRRWIEQGAEWKPHWAFLPPEKTSPPVGASGEAGAWQNPIDAFVRAKLESQQPPLSPAPEASRERLIRRVTLDLTGLPPTLEEIDAFLADDAPDAYEKVVDRLLASPRFGERMAVDWLDLARYADTYGYQADVYRAMWPWRDWVVRAFNTNLSYDQFISWQIAGDLLPNASKEQILATAFNRHHRQTNEGGSIEEEFRVEYVADRTITFGSAFLGLTLECARCHDHKYDPISQKEFYSLFSFFNNIDESGLYSHFTNAVPTPTLRLTDAQADQAIRDSQATIAEAESRLEQVVAARQAAFEAWLVAPDRPHRLAAAVEIETSKGQGKSEDQNPDQAAARPARVGPIGDFPLDAIEAAGAKVQNRADASHPGQAADAPEVVDGKVGHALRLSGENNVSVPLGNFERDDPFAIGLWIQTPDVKDRAIVLHRSRAWTDAGSRGYELRIENGRLVAGLIHFWPGNALAIRTKEAIPVGRWVHVALSYDGSSRAEGLSLHVDGRPADCEVLRDHLTRTIRGGGGDDLTIGQRFRDRGFKDGLVDELTVYDRAISSAEVSQLVDGSSLDRLLAADPKTLGEADRESLRAFYLAAVDPETHQAREALRAARANRSRLVDPTEEIMVMSELPEPRPAFVLRRGAYDAPGEPVSASTPASLPAFQADWPRNRLGLARWLTDPGHPLTARVAVNRWWLSLFGRGLVATPGDFGSQGQLPSHPELLDWLARELVDSGWNVKRMLRLIVCSATYRQDSDASADLQAADPDNVWLARGPRFRLPAEMIRDSALAEGGLLVGPLGGPPVKPYQPAGLWEEKSGLTYTRDVGPGSHRRSLYTFWKRTSPPPAMTTFDAAGREVCSVSRQTTATPLQALVLLNDPQFVEAARGLAQQAARLAGADPDARLARIFRTLTSRQPTAAELRILAELYHEQLDEFRSGRSDAAKLLAEGDLAPDPSLDPAECAALTVVAQALLSYDEAVVKR